MAALQLAKFVYSASCNTSQAPSMHFPADTYFLKEYKKRFGDIKMLKDISEAEIKRLQFMNTIYEQNYQLVVTGNEYEQQSSPRLHNSCYALDKNITASIPLAHIVQDENIEIKIRAGGLALSLLINNDDIQANETIDQLLRILEDAARMNPQDILDLSQESLRNLLQLSQIHEFFEQCRQIWKEEGQDNLSEVVKEFLIIMRMLRPISWTTLHTKFEDCSEKHIIGSESLENERLPASFFLKDQRKLSANTIGKLQDMVHNDESLKPEEASDYILLRVELNAGKMVQAVFKRDCKFCSVENQLKKDAWMKDEETLNLPHVALSSDHISKHGTFALYLTSMKQIRGYQDSTSTRQQQTHIKGENAAKLAVDDVYVDCTPLSTVFKKSQLGTILFGDKRGALVPVTATYIMQLKEIRNVADAVQCQIESEGGNVDDCEFSRRFHNQLASLRVDLSTTGSTVFKLFTSDKVTVEDCRLPPAFFSADRDRLSVCTVRELRRMNEQGELSLGAKDFVLVHVILRDGRVAQGVFSSLSTLHSVVVQLRNTTLLEADEGNALPPQFWDERLIKWAWPVMYLQTSRTWRKWNSMDSLTPKRAEFMSTSDI